mmetsp:Transcript_14997/g.20978  ORF Transcript_14997/g.20978 Transcript_14997/m.20978 type:complete len:96 (-) Transcript_14997:387-674(-)
MSIKTPITMITAPMYWKRENFVLRKKKEMIITKGMMDCEKMDWMIPGVCGFAKRSRIPFIPLQQPIIKKCFLNSKVVVAGSNPLEEKWIIETPTK